jgi:tetratricopeptide (TPR) repeat protein
MVEQKSIDKLINRAISVKDTSPDVALDVLERALKQSRERNYLKGEAESLFHLGRVHVALGDYRESISNLKSALELFEVQNNKEAQVNTLSLLGTNNSYIGNFLQSVNDFEKSLAIAKDIGNDNLTAKILNNMGGSYYAMDNLKAAKNCYLKSLKLKEKINDIQGLGACYTNLAIISRELNNIEEASDYINKSINIKKNFTDTFKDEASLAFAKNTLASLKSIEKNYSEALKIFEEVLDIYLKQNNLLLLSETYGSIAKVYLEMNDVVNALKALNAGEQFVKQINASRITDEYKMLHTRINQMKN